MAAAILSGEEKGAALEMRSGWTCRTMVISVAHSLRSQLQSGFDL